MFEVNKSLLIAYSAEQMFTLVNDVASYPEFLPWCVKTQIDQCNADQTVATLFIGYHGIEVSFSTANETIFPTKIILCHKSGPFQHLEGVWDFLPLAETACKVRFHIRFSFSNFLVEAALKKIFSHITETIVDAFMKRAEVVYGKPADL